MNIKRVLIICIVITIIMAIILTVKVKALEAEFEEISVPKEPIETEVLLSEVNGTEPPEEEVQVLTKKVDEEDLYILSHILHGECGSDTCPTEMQIATGSVFLNRIASPYFPNDAKSVAFQPNQYSCTREGGGYYGNPTERTIENAKWLLENGSQLPENVVFQSQGKQGSGVYKKVGNQYYCYK